MNPIPNKHGDGIITARRISILLFGVLITMAGVAVCIVVLLRYFYPVAPHLADFDTKIFTLGCMIIFTGLALIYTGNPVHVFKLIEAQRAGGRRFTDPPLESAPQQIPREKWEPIPPRQPKKPKPGA
jgi:hypothetical protein